MNYLTRYTRERQAKRKSKSQVFNIVISNNKTDGKNLARAIERKIVEKLAKE